MDLNPGWGMNGFLVFSMLFHDGVFHHTRSLVSCLSLLTPNLFYFLTITNLMIQYYSQVSLKWS